jgi:hypothetical protein
MAITRCPYCRAIIDKKDQYCNNCGTQLLFPEDESAEEQIPGERIIDEDFEEKDYEIPEGEDDGSEQDDEEDEEGDEEDEEDDERERDEDKKKAGKEVAEEEDEGKEDEEEEVTLIDEEKKEEEAEEKPLTPASPQKPGRTPKMKALTFPTEELEKIGKMSEYGDVTVEKFLEVLKEREARRADKDTKEKEGDGIRKAEEEPRERLREPGDDLPEESSPAPAERLIAPTDELPPWAKEIQKPGSIPKTAERKDEEAAEEGEPGDERLGIKEAYAEKEDHGEGGGKREPEEATEEPGEEQRPGAKEEEKEEELEMRRDVEEEELEEELETAEPPLEEKKPAREVKPSDSGIGLPERITQAKLPFDTAPVEDFGRKREPDKRGKEEAEEIREEREAAPLPPLKLSAFLKAKLFDMLFMAVFWLVSIWLASRSMEVGLFQLLSATTGTFVLYYGALLVLYFFLFHFFLGETLGDRLFRERD